jgi:hypothetical protein
MVTFDNENPDRSRPSSPQRRIKKTTLREVEGNARLTASVAALLLVLLAVEGVTVLRIRAFLSLHVFVGLLLILPVALKISSTGYGFVRYYAGSPAYRRKGPPPSLLRLLGPFVVLVTLALFVTGVALLFVGPGLRGEVLTLHKVSFILWFGAMAIHVSGRILDTARIAPRDFYWRTRKQITGAALRQWTIVASLTLDILLATLFVGRSGHFLSA